MKVYLNRNKDAIQERKIVDAVLVKDRATTVLVKLPDGNIIVRKKKRDVVGGSK